MKFSILFLSMFLTMGAHAEKLTEKSNSKMDCFSAREYITSLEFLRNYAKEESIQREQENRKIADRVSKYCTGSASRFIKVILLFDKLQLGFNNALKVGLMAAEKNDKQVEIFINLFKKLYLKDGFDLKAQTAFDLSKKFLFDTLVDLDVLEKEIDTLMDYCLSEKSMSLNKTRCANLSWELVATLENKDDRIADAFVKFYEYLTEGPGININSYEAMKLASKLVKSGPNSLENFRVAAVYAQKKEGLNLPRKDAITFATSMAQRSQRATY